MTSPYNEPLFDLLSYARRGPGRRDQVSLSDVLQIARIVGRTPEVMVKVLSRGANDLTAVRKHLEYIGRKGKVDLETDDGNKTQAAADILDDWDLEFDEYRAGADLSATGRKQPPRLVHKVLFSMPAGTPPEKVLRAVQNFCREEFALKHRYAMALHTDEHHPHVHVMIKSMSEQGERLNIRKAMLRQWRADFASHLRALGVPANATHRYIRGAVGLRKPDEIFRATLRGQSTHMRDRTEAVAKELAAGALKIERVKAPMIQARRKIGRAWQTVSDLLLRQERADLAQEVRKFVAQMPPVMTDKEYLAARLLEQQRGKTQTSGVLASQSPRFTPPQRSR